MPTSSRMLFKDKNYIITILTTNLCYPVLSLRQKSSTFATSLIRWRHTLIFLLSKELYIRVHFIVAGDARIAAAYILLKWQFFVYFPKLKGHSLECPLFLSQKHTQQRYCHKRAHCRDENAL